jgi:hypothetical protein
MPHRAVHGPEPGGPQPDPLDLTGGRPDVDHIAHAVLVLQQHGDACQDVGDHLLGADGDGQADKASPGHQRSKLHAEDL